MSALPAFLFSLPSGLSLDETPPTDKPERGATVKTRVGKTASLPVTSLPDRRQASDKPLGPCPRCGHEIGTMGFWTGDRYGLSVVCDPCGRGKVRTEPIDEADAVRRYGTLGGQEC